jgi:Uma2 family endonuclease
MMQPMPRVPPLDRPATYEDLVKLPDRLVAEIVDGELHASPRPALRHSRAERSLARAIGGPYDDGVGGPGGWWILVEPELHLGRSVLVPDLAGWRRSRMAELPDAAYSSLAPDWVCEVLSPSTASFDRVKKLGVYAREAVAHVWFVDPALRTLETLKLDGARWVLAGSYAGNDVVRAEPFDEIDLELARVWSSPPSPA